MLLYKKFDKNYLHFAGNDMESHNNIPVKVCVCPYWSESTKSCLSSKQGLYLPVPDHIHTYCRTGNHPFCPQFEQQDTDLLEYQNGSGKVADRRERKEADRRGCARISGSYSLQLAELQEDDNSTSLLDKKATTVDLSVGGIRLQTHCELPVNSMVSFSLNGTSDAPVQGIGQVKWCRSLDDGSVYHAGIVFTDSSISGAMRRYLGNSLT
jgi:hypothetical protein